MANALPPLIMGAQAAWGCPVDDAALPEQIDHLFYPEAAQGHGAAICSLGKIDALLPQPAPPSSFLHTAFFAPEDKLNDLLQAIDLSALQAVDDALTQIEPAELDPEIGLSVRLNQWAIQRCLRFNRGDSISSHESESYESLLKAFEILWTTRSRTGGLAESLGLMREAHS